MVTLAVALRRRGLLVRSLVLQLEDLIAARCVAMSIRRKIDSMGLAWALACRPPGSLTALPLAHARSSLASASRSLTSEATARLAAPARLPAAAAASCSHGPSSRPSRPSPWGQQWGSRGLSAEPASQGTIPSDQQTPPAVQAEARTPEAEVDALLWLATCINGQASTLRGETQALLPGQRLQPQPAVWSSSLLGA